MSTRRMQPISGDARAVAPPVATSGVARVRSCFDENVALDLVGGRLPVESQAAVLAHAESCETCRQLLADLAAADDPERSQCREWPRPVAPIALGPAMAGSYQLLEEIGHGAAGTVHRAVHRHSGAPAAVKLVPDAGMQVRFEREANALRSLSHPGIVRYLEHGRTGSGVMYLAMQWLDGQDLGRFLSEGTRMGIEDVLALGARMASALAHAHSRGCVHRDLSPKNVFVPNGSLADAVILDFGLVRVVRPDLSLTASEAIVGTPYYMAPEQVRGAYDVDARADLFAFGVLLFEVTSGRRPFEGHDLLTVWQKIVHTPAPALATVVPGVPPGLSQLVAHLLEKEPARRPQSAAFVHEQLCALQRMPASSAVSARVAPSSVPQAISQLPVPSSSGFKAWMVGLVIVLLALSALAAFGVQHAMRTPFTRGEPIRWEKLAAAVPEPDAAESAVRAEPETPSPAAAVEKMDPKASVELVCSGNDNIAQTGGHYAAASPGMPAVMVTGNCQMVLQDCVMRGPDSLSMSGFAKLTLRRCRVEGSSMLSGFGTLTLEGTKLPSPRRGGAVKVIVR